jgi:hypothetical protein
MRLLACLFAALTVVSAADAQRIAISPRPTTATVGDTLTFAATLYSSNGAKYTSTASVKWGTVQAGAILGEGKTFKLVVTKEGPLSVVAGWFRSSAPSIVADTLQLTVKAKTTIPPVVTPPTNPPPRVDTIRVPVPGRVDTIKIVRVDTIKSVRIDTVKQYRVDTIKVAGRIDTVRISSDTAGPLVPGNAWAGVLCDSVVVVQQKPTGEYFLIHTQALWPAGTVGEDTTFLKVDTTIATPTGRPSPWEAVVIQPYSWLPGTRRMRIGYIPGDTEVDKNACYDMPGIVFGWKSTVRGIRK